MPPAVPELWGPRWALSRLHGAWKIHSFFKPEAIVWRGAACSALQRLPIPSVADLATKQPGVEGLYWSIGILLALGAKPTDLLLFYERGGIAEGSKSDVVWPD